MANKAGNSQMTVTERVAGTLFFAVYLLVLPLMLSRIFNGISFLLGKHIDESLSNILYYYVLFAVTLLLFHSFLGKTTARFLSAIPRSLTTYGVGLVLFYGANELFYRVANMLFHSHTNLNDMTVAAQVDAAPRITATIVVLLAPFVEEVLFRGLVFGNLRGKSLWFAYFLSCTLFALMHVWTFALSRWDWSYFVLMLQYLVPGVVFAWVYDHSGTLWTSILLHATVNALSLWTIAG